MWQRFNHSLYKLEENIESSDIEEPGVFEVLDFLRYWISKTLGIGIGIDVLDFLVFPKF
jgi:hypothetical protein